MPNALGTKIFLHSVLGKYKFYVQCRVQSLSMKSDYLIQTGLYISKMQGFSLVEAFTLQW